MAISTNTIRKITIQGEGQSSLDSLAASVDKVTAAEQRLAGASKATATVTDIATKRQLSAADAYKRQTLVVVEGARAQDQLARATKVADDALRQGQITATQHAERLALLQQKYGAATTATTALTGATARMTTAFGAARGVLGAFGVSLGLAGAVMVGKSIFNMTADLQEQADQVLGAGGNVEAFQALRGVFLQTGISIETGDRIFARLSKTLGEATEGSKTAQDAFKRLGLGSKDLAGKTGDAALPLVAQRLLDIKDAATRAAIETDIFGKSGQKLESALEAIAVPADQLVAKARELGIAIDKDMIQKADDAKDRMELAWLKLSVSLAPIITSWVSGFSNFTTSVNGSASALENLIHKATVFGGTAAGARLGFSAAGAPGAVAGGFLGGVATGYATRDPDKTRAWVMSENRRLLADPNTSPAARARIEAEIRQDQAKGGSGNTRLVERPGAGASPYLPSPAANDNGAPAWAQTSEQISAAKAQGEKLQKELAARMKAAAAYELELLLPEVKSTPGIGQAWRDTLSQEDQQTSYRRQLRGESIDIMGRASAGNPFGAAGRAGQTGAAESAKDEMKERLGIIQASLDAEQISYQQAADARVAIEQDAQRKIHESEIALSQARLGVASDFFGNLASLSQSSNETLAAIGKAAAVTQATIDGVLAVQKALASYPPPINFAMAAAVGVSAAMNVSKILGFANGVVGLGGPGTGTSDSIPAWLSKGESVVKASATPGNRNTLMAMNAGANFDRAAPANSNRPMVIIKPMPGVVVEQVPGVDEGTVEFIARRVLHTEGGKMIETELSRPNSRGATALRRNTTAKPARS